MAVLVRLVREAVELRADLADLGEHHLLVRAAPVGEVVHEGALGVHVEPARAEERHLRVERVRHLDHLARADEVLRHHDGLGGLVIHRAALIRRAPLGRAALRGGGHAPRLRECRGAGEAESECKKFHAHDGISLEKF